MQMNSNAFAIVLFLVTSSSCENDISYYVDFIAKAQENALKYNLPTNARQFAATSNQVENFGTFDFIIIGAGSAGAIIANRLTEINNWQVLLLEAGTYGSNLTDIPLLIVPAQMSDYNWAYTTVPQTTSCQGMIDKICNYPRGKGIGGSSLINGITYSRGFKADYDCWSEYLRDDAWSYNTILKNFKKSEHFNHNDPEAVYEPKFHGYEGQLSVEYHVPKHPQVNTFIKAAEELGFKSVDYNANEEGVSPVQFTTSKGRRWDTGKAFIESIQNSRSNLKVQIESFVRKILINPITKRAYGVEFLNRGKIYRATVKREVILSAGAVGSPQILMLSGIGPKKHLRKLGIEMIKNLPVGQQFRDHPGFLGLNFEANSSLPVLPMREYVEEFINKGEGPLTNADIQGMLFYETKYAKPSQPDVEIFMIPSNASGELTPKGLHFTQETYHDIYHNSDISKSFNLNVVALHAKSTGSIMLRSSDPLDYPLIDPQTLSVKEDIDVLYEGIKLALKLSETQAFQSIGAKLNSAPLRACKHLKFLSKEYWYCAIPQVTLGFYHPLGTCAMNSVVDTRLRVYGIRGLRVADASVMPKTPGGHLSAIAIMIGEQLADFIKTAHLSQKQ